jgi:MFS family permease
MPPQMLLACVPDPLQHKGGFFEAFCIAVCLAFVTALAAIARILWLGEAASDRTQALVLVIGCGAFSAILITAFFCQVFTRGWNNWIRSAFAAILCSVLLVPAVMFCFAIENRLIEAHLEPGAFEDGRIREIIWSMIGAMGLFTPTGMRYLVPWTLLVLFTGAAVVFYHWPRQPPLNR